MAEADGVSELVVISVGNWPAGIPGATMMSESAMENHVSPS